MDPEISRSDHFYALNEHITLADPRGRYAVHAVLGGKFPK